MKVEVARRISDVDRNEWDALGGTSPLMSHAWLSTVESNTSEDIDFVYFLVRKGDALVAAAACQCHYRNDSAALNNLFYGSAARLAGAIGFRASPAVVIGSRYGIADPLLVDSSLSSRRAVAAVETLLAGIADEARTGKANIIIRNASNGPSSEALKRAGFLSTPEMPTAYIDIHWSTLAEFRRALRKVHWRTAKAIRHQNTRAKKNGIRLERVTDPGKVTDEMHRILDAHYRRLNNVPFPFGSSFLPSALLEFGDAAEVFIAIDSDGILGVIFGLRIDGVSRAMMIGVDGVKARHYGVYFLLIDHAMSRAIETGQKRLYYGRLLYDVKLRRGCSLEEPSMWIRGRTVAERSVLRVFVAARTRVVNRTIAKFRPLSDRNKAAFESIS